MHLGSIKDSVIGSELLAQYLLFLLNKQNMLKYVELFNLRNPTDDIVVLLTAVALKINARMEGKRLDLEHAARFLLQKYRTGDLGLFMLDEIPTT